MDNQEQTVTVTFTRDEFRNLSAFLKSLNMVRLSQNFDTDILSIAIAQTAQTIAAAAGEEDKDHYDVEMTEEMKKNLDIFLQNLNLTKLSGNTDSVTLSLAIVQVAQALARPAQQDTEQPVRVEKPSRNTKKASAPANVSPIRGEIVDE